MEIGCRETSDFFMPLILLPFLRKSLFLFVFSIYLCNFVAMKTNIDWKKAIVFLIVIGGLIYITKVELGMTSLNSFLTTLGILLILFVGDHFAQEIDDRIKRKQREKDEELL